MTLPPAPKLPKTLDVAISAILLISWALFMLNQHWNSWPPDLSALYLAAHLYETEQFQLIYAALAEISAWDGALQSKNRPDVATFPFLYPPLWAALFAPLSTVSPEAFFNSFYVVHVSMIVASVWLAYRIIAPNFQFYVWTILTVLLLWATLIANLALFHNQLQITVCFFTLLAFERYKSGAMIAAGVALAIAAAIKILPAALGLIFLLNRDFRAALATAISGLALLGLSLILAGSSLHYDFMDSLSVVSGRVSVEHINWNLESLLMQTKSIITGVPLGDLPLGVLRLDQPGWVPWINYGLLGAGILLTIHRTPNHPNRRLMGFLVLLTLAGPLAWIYHYLIILLLIPMVFTLTTTPRALGLIAAFGWLTSVQAFTWGSRFSEFVHAQSILGTITMIAVFCVVVTADSRKQTEKLGAHARFSCG